MLNLLNDTSALAKGRQKLIVALNGFLPLGLAILPRYVI
jgi:hypothetical protein